MSSTDYQSTCNFIYIPKKLRKYIKKNKLKDQIWLDISQQNYLKTIQ